MYITYINVRYHRKTSFRRLVKFSFLFTSSNIQFHFSSNLKVLNSSDTVYRRGKVEGDKKQLSDVVRISSAIHVSISRHNDLIMDTLHYDFLCAFGRLIIV